MQIVITPSDKPTKKKSRRELMVKNLYTLGLKVMKILQYIKTL